MNTTIFLIRHGLVENPNNIIYGSEVNVPLSKEGKEQILHLAEKLKSMNTNPCEIVSSPLLRAQQTSEIIADVFDKLPIIYSTNLLEIRTKGLAKYTLDWERGLDLYNYSGPAKFELESIGSQKERMVKEVNNAIQKNTGKTTFLVSHGDPLAVAYASLINPTEVLTGSTQIRKNYLKRGSAWKLVFDSQHKIVHNELIEV